MATCAFTEDVRQRYADAPLSVCPSCKSPTYRRVPSAPAAVLVAHPRAGTGRPYVRPYVTHERDGSETVYRSEGEAFSKELDRTGNPGLARRNLKHIRQLGYTAGTDQAALSEAIKPLHPGEVVK